MMKQSQSETQSGGWSRSRYWLNYFLQSRHLRPSAFKKLEKRKIQGSRFAGKMATFRNRIYQSAAQFQDTDPAYAQSLRLFSRSLALHHACEKPETGFVYRSLNFLSGCLRRHASLRFELTVQLLSAMIDDAIIAAAKSRGELTEQDEIGILHQERIGHIHFLSERLTCEFANINFVRRNLRRALFRVMFFLAWQFASRIRDYGDAQINAPLNWQASYHRFNEQLKRVIPYRRDELLRRVKLQEQQPFQKFTSVS